MGKTSSMAKLALDWNPGKRNDKLSSFCHY